MIQETIFRFGPNDSLLGILTQPATATQSSSDSSSASRPVAILLNAGIVHRSGPYRMNVLIARALANSGFSSLRIDLSGLGDSPIRTECADAAERAIRDIQDAFDRLASKIGADSFVIVGLCSGSYHAHQISLTDSRVAGAVFIDGFAFTTRQHQQRKRRGKLRYRLIRNAIKRRLFNLKAIDSLADSSEATDQGQFFEQCTDRLVIAGQIQKLIDRDQRLFFIYTGGHPDFSAEEQFNEMFGITPDGQQVSIEYFADAGHTFPILQTRIRLTESIVKWYQGFLQVECQAKP